MAAGVHYGAMEGETPSSQGALRAVADRVLLAVAAIEGGF